MRVLGIDPGSRVTGWGIVEERAPGAAHVASGTIALGAKDSLAARLAVLHAECRRLCEAFAPEAVVLERAFVARNVQTAFRLGEARGAVLAAVAAADRSVHEYAPAEVKLATVGHGRAEKEQMIRGIAARLQLAANGLKPDAADALALALCHLTRLPLLRALDAANPNHVTDAETGPLPPRVPRGRAGRAASRAPVQSCAPGARQRGGLV